MVQETQPQILDVSAQADAARQILSQPLTLAIPDAAQGEVGPFIYTPEILANMIMPQRRTKWRSTECSGGSQPERITGSAGTCENTGRPPAFRRKIYFQ